MDRLWTPWRFDYISKVAQSDTGCVFCRIVSENCDRENLVLYRGKTLFAILNLFPYTAGHILLVANRHLSFLGEASSEELHEFIETARLCELSLRAEYKPEGFNMGFNLGRAAGAGVDHHLHMHVLPRWTGDSNFVSVVAETRILPEELPKTFERLRPYFSKSE
ncbi:MAG TPA: HIT domain-containing protein [Acidobacteriota bacterium]|nr:HIT domain-containing protein [Acidobacteriota bacterium]